MLQYKEGGDKVSPAARPSSLGRLVIPSTVLVAIVLTSPYSYDSRELIPGATLFCVTAAHLP